MVSFIHSDWVKKLLPAGLFFTVLLGVLVIIAPKPTHAENERVVTVYHDNIEQTIVTDAKTVGDALTRAHVSLNKYDTVEPSTDTVLVAPGYSVNVYRARPVLVIDGVQRYTVMTSHTSAREIVQAAGLTLFDEDTTTMDRIDDFVGDGAVGLKMTIHRATLMNLVLYGQATQIRTQAKTVGELMAQKHIVLSGQDGASMPANAPITAGMTLTIWRNGAQTITNAEDIPFATKQILDTDHPIGWQRIQQPGAVGKRMVTYQVTMQNGQEVSRMIIQSVVTQDPHDQIELIGAQAPVDLGAHKTEAMAAAGIDAGDYGFVDYIVSHESGWCATKLQGHPGACPGLAPASIPSNLGYGVCQATPGSKMSVAGADWQTNPVTQLRWCSSYAQSRYGSWAAAYNHWLAAHSW